MTTPTLLASAPHTITGANRILAQLEGRNVVLRNVSNVALNYTKYLYLGLLLLVVIAVGWFSWGQWKSQQTSRRAMDAKAPLITGAPSGLHSTTAPKAANATAEAPIHDKLPEITQAIIVDDLSSEAEAPPTLQKLQKESLNPQLSQAQKKKASKSSAQTAAIIDLPGKDKPKKDKPSKKSSKGKSGKDKPSKGKGKDKGKSTSSKPVAEKTQAHPGKPNPLQLESVQDQDAEVLESILLLDAPESKKTPRAADHSE